MRKKPKRGYTWRKRKKRIIKYAVIKGYLKKRFTGYKRKRYKAAGRIKYRRIKQYKIYRTKAYKRKIIVFKKVWKQVKKVKIRKIIRKKIKRIIKKPVKAAKKIIIKKYPVIKEDWVSEDFFRAKFLEEKIKEKSFDDFYVIQFIEPSYDFIEKTLQFNYDRKQLPLTEKYNLFWVYYLIRYYHPKKQFNKYGYKFSIMRFYLNNKLIGVQEFYNRYLPVVIKQLKEYINKNFKALPQKDYWSQRWFHGFYCFSASLAKIKRGRRKKDFVMFWDKNDPKDILAGRKQLDYDEDDDDAAEE